MRTVIYLNGEPKQALAVVDLEVVPKGIYEFDGKAYQTVGVPRFIIRTSNRSGSDKLVSVELTVIPAIDSDLL